MAPVSKDRQRHHHGVPDPLPTFPPCFSSPRLHNGILTASSCLEKAGGGKICLYEEVSSYHATLVHVNWLELVNSNQWRRSAMVGDNKLATRSFAVGVKLNARWIFSQWGRPSEECPGSHDCRGLKICAQLHWGVSMAADRGTLSSSFAETNRPGLVVLAHVPENLLSVRHTHARIGSSPWAGRDQQRGVLLHERS